MRGKNLFLGLFLLSCFLTAKSFEVSYQFSEPVFKDGKAVIEDCDQLTIPFQPKISVKQIRLLLEAGEEIDKVEVLNTKTEKVFKNVEILQNEPLVILSQKSIPEKAKLSKLFKTDSFFPENLSTRFKTSYKNGHPIASGLLYPMQYNPVSKELKFYQEISLKISTKKANNTPLVKTNSMIKRTLKQLVNNKEAVETLSLTKDLKNTSYDYLIITSNELHNSFLPLLEFNKKRCLKTKIATVEDIDSTETGFDLQDKIRNYIRNEYQTNNIRFVLLGGDDEIIPHRGFRSEIYDYGTEYYDEKDIPADMYYSCLDGSWQLEESEYFGEYGSEDFFSEVAVSRFPVDSEAETANMINKTISFRTGEYNEDINSNLLIGEFLWSAYGGENWVDTYGKFYMEQLRDECTENSYITKGFNQSWDTHTLYEYDQNWSATQLVHKINDEKVIWIDHLGHSNTGYNMGLSNVTNQTFSNDGTNANYFLIYSQGCYSGAFDNRMSNGAYTEDCIGEKFVTIENAAFGYIGNSRYGLGSPYDTDGSGQRFHRFFHDALFDKNISRIQEMNSYSKEMNAAIMLGENPELNDNLSEGPYYGQLHWICYCVNYLGDPALPMWNGTPKTISPETIPENLVYGQNLNFKTLPYAYVALTDEDEEILINTVSNENGYANIPFENLAAIYAGDNGTLKLRINGENAYLFEKDINYNLTAVNEHIQKDFTLSAYPNPFNPSTSITYHLKKNSRIKIAVYNANGKEVQVLAKGAQEKGNHQVRFNGANLTSGIYFLKLLADDNILQTKKITLIK